MRPVFVPESIPEALSIRADHPEAIWMAGGTDLLVALRRRPVPDDHPLILLERVPELAGIEAEDGIIRIGACVSFNRIASDPRIASEIPILAQAAAAVGGPALRNMATIGGNVCTASPAADSLPALSVLDASVELVSVSGTRRLSISEFVTGPRTTRLRPDELLKSISVPRNLPQGTMQRYEKIGNRKALAIAVASMAAVLVIEDDIVREARLAWGSVGPTVMRCPPAADALMGQPLTEQTLRSAASYVPPYMQPIDDIRASADFRRMIAGSLLLRLLDP